MQVRSLSIDGAWEFTPHVHSDSRGQFFEAFAAASLDLIGKKLTLTQVNVSVSEGRVIRGIHGVRVPPGQAKYVMCLFGEILDVVVDLRPDSTTFGSWDTTTLDDVSRRALYVSPGLGHAFQVTSPSATVAYLTDSPYSPSDEFAINPLDPILKIPWLPLGEPILSKRDATAQSFREAVESPRISPP